ncbi:hypothetical protein OGAPHI_001452 [Ogataea philodendri]|uniref:Zn(2)-C6 fungal-type domain-containing protein n=1 Tax=Ogataea philodendri TaxID=1378263 RepID=A0A9P8T7Y9_9ASCO|nr:uncharacterized protein OGAPHI_001452 [Ogataea philodendri]KAH3669331.1 hypothetical protein OGAPHI_001452 [Ogataea philodendri]
MQTHNNSPEPPEENTTQFPRLPSFREIQARLQASALPPPPPVVSPSTQAQLPSISMLLHQTRPTTLPPVPYSSYPALLPETSPVLTSPSIASMSMASSSSSSHEESAKAATDLSKTKPKRTRKACDLCNQKRTKCSGELPRCSQCARTNSVCTYLRTEKKRGRASSNYPKIIIRRKPTKYISPELKTQQEIPTQHSPPSADSVFFKYPILHQVSHVVTQLQLSHVLVEDLVELYFQTSFPVMILNPNQILSQDSSRVRKINEPFILSIMLCGTALLQVSPTQTMPKETSAKLLDLLFIKLNTFLQNSTKLDHDDIISYINLARAYMIVGGMQEAVQVVDQAIGLALKLKINVEDSSEYPLFMEEKRRAWFCLVTLESDLKKGTNRPLLASAQSSKICLPIDDQDYLAFNFGVRGSGKPYQSPLV